MKYFLRYSKTIILFLLIISFSCFSQENNIKKIIESKSIEKTTLLENWFNKNFFFLNPDQKIKVLNELEQIALKNTDYITLSAITFYRGLYIYGMDCHQYKESLHIIEKAIQMAKNNHQQLQLAYFKHSLGFYYFNEIKKPAEALKNMLQAHYIFEQIGYQKINDPSGRLDRLAYVYYHLSNFNESIKYLKLSLKYPMENSRRYIGILNTIGANYHELIELDSAKKYFKLSLQKALRAHDTAWIGINSGDLGQLLLNKKKYLPAKPLLEKYLKCSIKVKDSALIIEALTGLAEVDIHSKNNDLALKKLKKAELLFSQTFKTQQVQVQNYSRKHYLLNVLSQAWEIEGNHALSLNYLKEANKVKDSIENRAKVSKNRSIQHMFEVEQHNNRLKFLNEEKKAEIIKKRLYFFIGILFAIIIVLLYSRQIRENKIQKQKEVLLSLEKEQAEHELRLSKLQLDEYLQNLKNKTSLLEKIQSEMDFVLKNNQTFQEEEQKIFHKLTVSTILTEDEWRQFKLLFEKVHSGFFIKLKATFPNLTPGEIRLCSLIKLGFSSHQIAAMMGISIMSVKKNRQRLRKKINLQQDQKLEHIFLNF